MIVCFCLQSDWVRAAWEWRKTAGVIMANRGIGILHHPDRVGILKKKHPDFMVVIKAGDHGDGRPEPNMAKGFNIVLYR